MTVEPSPDNLPTMRGRLTSIAGGLWASTPFWIALWSLPLWSALFSSIRRHRATWLADYNSVVCGAERAAAHQPLYTTAACPHAHMSMYVYPPWIAQVVAVMVRVLGEPLLLVVYVLVFGLALVFLLWAALVGRLNGVSLRERVPFLAFTSGNWVAVGNVAVIAQASIVAAALFLGADSLMVLLAIAGAALIKPTYLTYLALPALQSSSILRRVGTVAVVGGAVAALTLSNIAGLPEWRAFLVQVALDPDPGGGFLRWIGDMGVHTHAVQSIAYLTYAALLAMAGLIVAEFGMLDRRARLWLALTLAVLILPRVMAYDIALLGPGLLVVVQAGERLRPSLGRALGLLFRVACAIYLLSSLLGGKASIGHSIAMMLLVLGVFWLGVSLVRCRSGRRPLEVLATA